MNGQQIAPCYMYVQKRTLSWSTLRLVGVKKSTQFRYTIDLLAILCLLFLLDLYYLKNDLKKSSQISEEETTHKDSLFSQIQS